MVLLRGTMIKLDVRQPSLAYNPDPALDLGCSSHLLVLVSPDIDYSAATQRVWEIARSTGMSVKLLGLCKEATEQPTLHRKLVTMASLLQDGSISAESKIGTGKDWIKLVKSHYEAGDVIVCFADQQTGTLRRSLCQVLESNLKATVYILSLPRPEQPRSNILPQVIAWLGAIGIIIGFGILQANLMLLPEGWMQTVLLILSVIPEFWSIYAWHAWFA